MPIVRAQVSIPAASTVAEDTVTNTFHFTTTGWDETIRGSIAGGLQALYESWDTYKSSLMAWPSARVKFYDLSEPEPRVPIDDISLSLSTHPTGTPLPSEVAVCMSFRAEYVSGSSQARRRGRVFFGPLNQVSGDSTGRVAAAALTLFQGGAQTFLDLSDSAADWAWVVWSPTAATAYPVVGGWFDNAYDTQRGRGVRATSHLTYAS